MSSVKSIVLKNLSALAPTAFQKYMGNEKTYITFFEYNQNGAMSADDDVVINRHSIQVDIWSEGNYENLTKQVKDKLSSLGFTKNFETETYEMEANEIVIFHKILRFFYFTHKNQEE